MTYDTNVARCKQSKGSKPSEQRIDDIVFSRLSTDQGFLG